MANEPLIERIREALERAGTSKRSVAVALNISPQAITSWLRTGRISKESLEALATLAGVHSRDILFGPMPPSDHMKKPSPIPAYSIREFHPEERTDDDVMIDVVEVELSAGSGRAVPEFRTTKRRLPFSADWLRRKKYKAEDLKVMPVRGDSMLPKLADGDAVLINTADRRVVDGQIYALVLGNDAKIKRLRWRADGALIVLSDNPDKGTFPDEAIKADEAAEIYIIGRAVQRSGGL